MGSGLRRNDGQKIVSSKLKAILLLVFTVFVWGVAPALVRSFSLKTGPADAVVIRNIFTALSALPLFLFAGWRIKFSDIPNLLLISCVGMFGYFLGSIFGYSYVPAGFGSMVIAVQPLLIALIAAGLGADQLNRFSIAGLIISFIGTLYLFGGNMGGAMTTKNMLMGGALLLLCDISWAIYVIYSKPLVRKYGTFKISAWTLVLCALPALPFISSTTLPAALALTWQDYMSLAFLSMLGTVICMVTWNYATGYLSATTMGASLYSTPVLAVLSGWALLGEAITMSTVIAGIIIMAGVAVAEFGSSRRTVST
jgi:drug/metabolite transporter (DMT)-like permease